MQTAELTAQGCHAKLSWCNAPPEDVFLGPIIVDTVDLLETVDLSRLRQCHGVNCGWLFIDRSKGNRRRWCDMATCGNVSKARRHYRRRKKRGP